MSGKKRKRKKARNGKQMASVLGLSVLLCSLAFFSVSLANVVDLDDSNFDSVSVPPCMCPRNAEIRGNVSIDSRLDKLALYDIKSH